MRTAGILLLLAAAGLAQEREITACEICGGTVYQTPKTYVSGNTKYIYIDDPPYKPYCNRCQRDINNGEIDPKDPPHLAPRDGEEMGDNPYGNPYAVDRFDWQEEKKPAKDEHAKQAESGFGALWYVIAIVAVSAFALRFFLRS